MPSPTPPTPPRDSPEFTARNRAISFLRRTIPHATNADINKFINDNPELFPELYHPHATLTELDNGRSPHPNNPSYELLMTYARAFDRLHSAILAHAPEEPEFIPMNVTDTNEVIRKTVAYVRYLEQKLYEIENEISNS